ncbi:replication stress response regulator SDE2 [Puntigrus tetrazona]|uniref:replication stress response regulator SDE2 n=1 Tax=Puntigrus tetrazona TaxID=1606681 RepID=UPI001C8943C6|nr:replication stress response regulator SDE2 [Puntigrus tetrazona]
MLLRHTQQGTLGTFQNNSVNAINTSQVLTEVYKHVFGNRRGEDMEFFVISPNLRFINLRVAPGSTVSDLIDRFAVTEGASFADFYVKSNGRISRSNESLQSGAVYRVEPRLCGGKGGFGSMLRALGAQIEKTTNREACRDLSGRRLRDVNHEKQMADWLKKQADREAEKEQRRLERIQRKLAEPKHYFTDTDYEQQCHDLSERLEDSVLKGMQASSSGLVKVDEGPSRKRPTPADSEKKAKKKCFWSGLGGLEETGSSGEGSEDSDGEAFPSTSGASCSSDAAKRAAQPPASTRGSNGTDPRERPGGSSSSSSRSPAPSSPAQEEEEEVQKNTEKESTAETGQNGSIEENKSSPAPSSSTQVEEEEEVVVVQKGCTSETGQNVTGDEDKSQVEPAEAESSRAQEEEAEGPLDLLSASGPEQLEALGLEQLKKELMERGMKCGGTLQERAARLFSVKGLSPDQIDPALLAKPTKGKKK